MIVAIDVHYRTTFAKVVAIEFDQWTDKIPTKISETILEEVAAYVPGEFYKRELPCLLEIIKQIDRALT